MNLDANKLAVRSLNYWRPQFTPTYLGLRLFLRQIPDTNLTEYLNHYLFRKLPIRKVGRYRKIYRFKSLKTSGDFIYRDFYAASPTSALAEAYCLQILSTIKSLKNRPNVYSYRWPRYESEGRSFAYFFSGYKERNNKVAELLQNNPNLILLVYDIQNFYPAINKEETLRRLKIHINELKDKKYRSFVSSVCEQGIRISKQGVPIGPALSHVFGNIAFEQIDSYMNNLIGERYLRYVDDIFLLLTPNEIKDIEPKLKNLIQAEGLLLNDRKYDQVSKDDWVKNVHTEEEEKLSVRFEAFIQRIRLFLWLNPNNMESLQKQFKEAGLLLPFKRFSLDAGYGRFHRFMHGILKQARWKQILKILNENENSLLNSALQLRKEFYAATEKLIKLHLPESGMKRKLLVQRLRFFLNRLLYLSHVDDFPNLLDLAPDIDEFYKYKSLINAMIEKNVDSIIGISGLTVLTFASLWQQQTDSKLSSYDKKKLNLKGAIESICLLSSFGIVDPSKSWLKTLDKPDSELVCFSKFTPPKERLLKDHSFEDEIRSLQLNESTEAMRNIVNSRYSDLETISLDGLLLSHYGSS